MEECVLMAACVEHYKDTPYEEKLKNTMLYWNELLNASKGSKKFLKENKNICLVILDKLKENGLTDVGFAIILLRVYIHLQCEVEHNCKDTINTYKTLITMLKGLAKIKK
ncbi:MAG: hypothetical protein IJY26_01120 [Clostridia bacterium]|nr:hypothetical protein [Clostridia bacterium]